jgi:hypothetical protein
MHNLRSRCLTDENASCRRGLPISRHSQRIFPPLGVERKDVPELPGTTRLFRVP